MGFFSRRKINKDAVSQPRYIRDFFPVSANIYRQDGTSFACIDRIASEFASLNFGIYDAKTRQKKTKHSLYAVIKQPNLEDGHFNFFYQSASDYYSNKGCFWRVIRINGNVVSLFRLNPAQVVLERDENNRRIYSYNGERYTDKDVLYIPSRFDYSTRTGGKSIYDAVNGAFETARNIDRYASSSFENGIIGKRLVIDVSGAYPNITPEQSQEIKNSFQGEYGGTKNAGRPILKKKGIEYSEIGTPTDNQSAELSRNREYQEHEIAKIFGVPSGLLNVTKDTNLENVFTLFLEFAIKPLATQFQEAINNLLEDDEYFEFDYNGILKVSMSARIDAYVKQINNGILSLDEVRSKENLAPIEAGDTHFMPANMMPWTEEIKKAYMAKQKNEANNPTNKDAQHFVGGDDKQ